MNSYATKLKQHAHKLIFIDKDTVSVGANEIGLTELIDGTNLKWTGSYPRLSGLEKANKLSHNRNTPIFKAPTGDRPHIFVPNMMSTRFGSQKFPAIKGPMTMFVYYRPRKAVPWEGGIGLSVQARDRGDRMEISNFAGGVDLKGVGKPVYDRPSLAIVVSNGDKSRLIINKKQIGDYVTLKESYVDELFYGNPAHTQEHDLFFAGLYFGVMPDKQMDEVYKIANSYLPVLSLPEKPVIYDIEIGVNKEGYYLKNYKYHSPNDVPIDLASLKVEWITGGDLDKQTFLGTGKQFNIKPAKQELAAIVSCKDRDGKYYTGIPFRSEFLKDERT